MKVIDLLNKIANGETPKKIFYDDRQWFYDEKLEDYRTDDDSRIDWRYTVWEYLNDEVEVIEEEPRDIEVCGSLFTRSEYNRLAGIKEDKTIQTIHDFQIGCGAVTEDRIEPYIKTLFHQQAILYLKINEIIDKINKGE